MLQVSGAQRMQGIRGVSRIILDADRAAMIYQHKIELAERGIDGLRGKHRKSPSVKLARVYGVSPKAIRDIWNKRTWTSVTDKMDDTLLHPTNLECGRPFPEEKLYADLAYSSTSSFQESAQVDHEGEIIDPTYRLEFREGDVVPSIAQLHSSSNKRDDKIIQIEYLFQSENLRQDPKGNGLSAENDPFHYDWPHW
mmetsp:Transcript_50303/g.132177  ORF Transcript_50303/g.132177 Transcript_50303/m.132177 type:complete len:196 (-) Transcript_50303:53-640(-)